MLLTTGRRDSLRRPVFYEPHTCLIVGLPHVLFNERCRSLCSAFVLVLHNCCIVPHIFRRDLKGKRTVPSILILLALVAVGCGPTAAPVETSEIPTTVVDVEPTEEPTAEPMLEPTTALAAEPTLESTAIPTDEPTSEVEVPKTLRLPDFGGRTMVAVTGNDYTLLNFVDPLTGEVVGWEYDTVNGICRWLNCTVGGQVTAWIR